MGMDTNPAALSGSAPVAASPTESAPSRVARGIASMGLRRSLFSEHWWCDASSPGAWNSIEIALSSVRKMEFIYAVDRKYGFTELTMPYLSRVMDIVDLDAKETCELSLSEKIDITREIIAKLPKHDAFFYTLAPESEFELAFNLSGFSTQSQYTFRRLCPADDHLMLIDPKTRQNIRRAGRTFTVARSSDLDTYLKVFRQYMKEKSQTNQVNEASISRIWQATQARGVSTILNVVCDDGSVAASAILIWDDVHLYYWLSSRVPSKSKNNANSLLIWEALEFSQTKGLIFDMDGFNSPESGLFLAKYRLNPIRRIKIRRETSAYSWAASSRMMLKRIFPNPLKQKISKSLAGY
jgi:hypothetical protein